MHNIKMTVAYDGTDFHGWQIQPGKPTIQGALGDVARKLTQEKIFIQGAGRTDAGVHALGQVVNFKTNSGLTPPEFRRAFNALLPPAIRVLDAEEMDRDFNARWSAQGKTYQYRIFRGRVVSPFTWRYVLHYPYPLDEDAMIEAAQRFEGEQDFTSFAASSGSEDEDNGRATTRKILSAEVRRCRSGEPRILLPETQTTMPRAAENDGAADELVFTVHGKSFLRYMVRKMVGTLLEIGRGRMKPDFVTELFELKDRSRSGPTVPPQGLWLVSVDYPQAWWQSSAGQSAEPRAASKPS
jgi:tRNA pseudouridine38-40 synthase